MTAEPEIELRSLSKRGRFARRRGGPTGSIMSRAQGFQIAPPPCGGGDNESVSTSPPARTVVTSDSPGKNELWRGHSTSPDPLQLYRRKYRRIGSPAELHVSGLSSIRSLSFAMLEAPELPRSKAQIAAGPRAVEIARDQTAMYSAKETPSSPWLCARRWVSGSTRVAT